MAHCVLQEKKKKLTNLFKEGLFWCLEDLNANQLQAATAGTRDISECAKALSAASDHSFSTYHGLPYRKPKFRSLNPPKASPGLPPLVLWGQSTFKCTFIFSVFHSPGCVNTLHAPKDFVDFRTAKKNGILLERLRKLGGFSSLNQIVSRMD